MSGSLRPGLYERLVSGSLARELESLPSGLSPRRQPISAGESADRIARYVRDLIVRALGSFEDKPDGLTAQVQIANGLLLHLGAELARHGAPEAVSRDDLLTQEILLALLREDPLTGPQELPRPGLPLAETHLLINARGEHQLGHELSLELGSADRVDLLCSFLLWGGFKRLEDPLRRFCSRQGAQLRVLTTVYMGATEPRVLNALHEMGATIRVSYDTQRTRLHAKAWLLHRDSGHSTAYVGSSNLSSSALTDGLEWNIRIGDDSPLVLDKFASAFETYWRDPLFEPYDPSRDLARLRKALQGERREAGLAAFAFELSPRPFQEAILEKLESERFVHGRMRNLVVAATGTGKTMIAAFDYKRLAARFRALHGRPPRLLFVAHRKELLRQALSSFRAVLKSSTFGELLADGERPGNSDFLFASVQSLSNIEVTDIPPGRWDIVVIDEFHHAEAPSYARWLKHLTPWVLVGLTATPERGDGTNVAEWFGGHIAVELRLWDAIEQGFLVPFQYFGLRDPVDLSPYWRRGQLDLGALDNVLTGHHIRAEAVYRAVVDSVADPSRMRAIGFCVGQGHAHFMAQYFSDGVLPSATALGSDDDRAERIQKLRDGQLRCLFTVDALSEGVDVPEMDTALLLRPTASSTVFLQQLGRGLRLSDGKRCLTVLDLVSTPDRKFSVERKFQALLGATRREFEKQLVHDFPLLPPGCDIRLTADAREIVLTSVREALSRPNERLLESLRSLGPAATLDQVLQHSELELGELYLDRSLTQLRRRAGFALPPAGPEEDRLSKGLARLITLDDPQLLSAIAHDCRQLDPPSASVSWRVVLATLMGKDSVDNPRAALDEFWRHGALVSELRELCDYLATQGAYAPVPSGVSGVPLLLHCHYRREQIVAGLATHGYGKAKTSREGVLFLEESSLDVFFVTLDKPASMYAPTVRYKDYPISRDQFHWQSMSNTTTASKRGQRNLNHRSLGVTPLLFVRLAPRDVRGEAQPFLFLGPLELESATGEKPISITWKLRVPMPAAFFEAARVVT